MAGGGLFDALIAQGEYYRPFGIDIEILPFITGPADLGMLSHRWHLLLGERPWADDHVTEQDQPVGADVSKFLDMVPMEFAITVAQGDLSDMNMGLIPSGGIAAVMATMRTPKSNHKRKQDRRGGGDVRSHIAMALDDELVTEGVAVQKGRKKKKTNVWHFRFRNVFIRVGYEELFFHDLDVYIARI